jgi:hypothetical protein
MNLLEIGLESVYNHVILCQWTKLPGLGYGYLLPQDAFATPWFEVPVDVVGPW